MMRTLAGISRLARRMGITGYLERRMRVREYLEFSHLQFGLGLVRVPPEGDPVPVLDVEHESIGAGEAAPLPNFGSGASIAFVIDCSNGMAGEPLRVAKAMCRRLIGGLADDQSFNVIAYGSGAWLFGEQWYAASQKAKRLAGEFLDLINVMGNCAVEHAVQRALRHPSREQIDIVLIGKADDRFLLRLVPLLRERSIKVHCIDYSGTRSLVLRRLSRQTGALYVAHPEPRNAQPISPDSLPSKFVCFDTAIARVPRPPVPFHPDTLKSALQRYLQLGGRAAAQFDWSDVALPPRLQGLTELRGNGKAEVALVSVLLETLEGLGRIGGVVRPLWERNPDRYADPEVGLEMRMLVMESYREWCLQEVVFNPCYDEKDIPMFLRL